MCTKCATLQHIDLLLDARSVTKCLLFAEAQVMSLPKNDSWSDWTK